MGATALRLNPKVFHDSKQRKPLKANRAFQAKTIIKLTHRTFHTNPLNIRGKQESCTVHTKFAAALELKCSYDLHDTSAIAVRHRMSWCQSWFHNDQYVIPSWTKAVADAFIRSLVRAVSACDPHCCTLNPKAAIFPGFSILFSLETKLFLHEQRCDLSMSTGCSARQTTSPSH